MAKNKVIQFGKGVAWQLLKGVRKGIHTFGEAAELYYTCCGPDCCENIYRFIDKDDGVTYVKYVFQGAEVFETEAAYLVKVANGDFTY